MAFIQYSAPNTLLSGNPDAAPDLNELRDDAVWLDMLSYRGRVPYTDQFYTLNDNGLNPAPLGRMSFQFRTGLTTGTFVIGYNQGVALKSATLQISFNGASVLSTTLLTGTNTYTVTLTGRGYTDYQFVDVIVQVQTGTGVPGDWDGTNVFRLYDAYVSPVVSVMTTSWPGVPTFGANSVANLAQLASAVDWLMNRMAITTQPAFFSQQYRSVSSWVNTELIYQGGIAKSNGADRLKISVGYLTVTNQSEHLEIFINDILVVTGPTWVAGNSGNYLFDVDISSYANATLFALRIMFVCVTAAPTGVRQHSSRLIIGDIYTDRASYSPASAPTTSSIRESLTFGTLQTRLNAIGTVVSNAYSRMLAATDVFDRIRMFRWMPAVDDGQRTYWASVQLYVPSARRAHDAMWVRGKGVKIAYGARKVEASLDDSFTYSFASTADVIGGTETVTDTLVYLDSFPGLYPGMPFCLLGDDIRAVYLQLR